MLTLLITAALMQSSSTNDEFPTTSDLEIAGRVIGIEFEEAELEPIARSFYMDNRRVQNDKIKNELGVQLKYEDFKAGLKACMEAEDYALSLFKGMGG